ncbi:hypothetical protein Cpir12675_006143 [Ceratocystis pirilliformis]|uniref:Uncharacterized protein n=1 Tax=Ceratocystis pirilliformis TaxID=259994 RepID=A0ABR3YKW0_9PEZI
MSIPCPKTITSAQFFDTLARYACLVKAISTSEAVKPGRPSLVELDRFRYIEAPHVFGLGSATKSAMGLEAVKLLVEWKLRHGKFRPTLMSLVSNNPEDLAKATVHEAIESYAASGPMVALDILKRLKGIGPATASLLLSVHDSENVLFFSDEAYYWLCCGGKKQSIKYKAQEYNDLAQEAAALMRRLEVKALDIEKVAYVLMKENLSAASSMPKIPTTKASIPKGNPKLPAAKRKPQQSKVAGTKNSGGKVEAGVRSVTKRSLQSSKVAPSEEPLRRSKRNKT